MDEQPIPYHEQREGKRRELEARAQTCSDLITQEAGRASHVLFLLDDSGLVAVAGNALFLPEEMRIKLIKLIEELP